MKPKVRVLTAEQARPSDCVQYVVLSSLRPNPLNPRTEIGANDPEMAELVASITSSGLLQPLLVTPDHLIVAGHRRAVACRLAGLTEVPVFVRDLDERTQLEAMLAENIARRSLNPLEMAQGLQGLIDRKRSLEEACAAVGVGRETARKHLLILKLPQPLREKIAQFKMPVGYAPHLLELPNDQSRTTLGLRACNEGWLVSELATRVRETMRPSPPQAAPAVRPRASASPTPRTVAPDVGSASGYVLDMLNGLVRLFTKDRGLVKDAAVRTALQRVIDAFNGKVA